MTGKEKCEVLKRLRKLTAQKYGIEYEPAECDFQEDCNGYCEKCDSDAQYIESELVRMEAEGKLKRDPIGNYTVCAPFEYVPPKRVEQDFPDVTEGETEDNDTEKEKHKEKHKEKGVDGEDLFFGTSEWVTGLIIDPGTGF